MSPDNWRTPMVVLTCGTLILLLAFEVNPVELCEEVGLLALF